MNLVLALYRTLFHLLRRSTPTNVVAFEPAVTAEELGSLLLIAHGLVVGDLRAGTVTGRATAHGLHTLQNWARCFAVGLGHYYEQRRWSDLEAGIAVAVVQGTRMRMFEEGQREALAAVVPFVMSAYRFSPSPGGPSEPRDIVEGVRTVLTGNLPVSQQVAAVRAMLAGSYTRPGRC